MAKLNQLIKDLCPAGVPYLKISDIADTFIGLATSVTKYKSESGVQLLHNSDISEGKIIVKTVEYITEAFAQKNSKKLLRKNDVITVHTGNVGTSAVITEEYDGCIGFTTISSRVKNQNQISPEYLCAFLNSNASKEQIAGKSISDRNNLNLAAFDEIIIPVPPLPVQNEIVRILNNFAELTAELTTKLAAELAARKQQYEYFRDTLIEKHASAEKVMLNTVCEVYDGTHQTPEYTDEGVPFVSVENINDLQNTAKFISEEAYAKFKIKPRPDDVFMTRIGSIGKCAVVQTNDDLAYYVSLALLRPNLAVLNSNYLKHYIESGFGKKELHKRILWTAVPLKINKEDIGKLLIAIPPLEEQERIVSILDRFDALCNDITACLPAEIEARQKQYEFYRDKLLTFKERVD